MSEEEKNNKKKQEKEETIDDLVETAEVINTRPTILSEEENKTEQVEQQRFISRNDSLEDTASESPAPRRETIDYDPITSQLSPLNTRDEQDKVDLKYHPEKLYEPKYSHDKIGEKKEEKKEKIYTTKREIIS